jgi:hypothetical protein
MAEQDTTTPARGRSPEFERQLANAFRELESIVCDVRNATSLMEIAAEDTVFTAEGWLEKEIRSRFNEGLKGYRIYVFTEDQSNGVDYALRHLGDLTRKLYRDYYAGFGEEAA